MHMKILSKVVIKTTTKISEKLTIKTHVRFLSLTDFEPVSKKRYEYINIFHKTFIVSIYYEILINPLKKR